MRQNFNYLKLYKKHFYFYKALLKSVTFCCIPDNFELKL